MQITDIADTTQTDGCTHRQMDKIKTMLLAPPTDRGQRHKKYGTLYCTTQKANLLALHCANIHRVQEKRWYTKLRLIT